LDAGQAVPLTTRNAGVHKAGAMVVAWLPAGGADNGLAPITATTVAQGTARSDGGSASIALTTQLQLR